MPQLKPDLRRHGSNLIRYDARPARLDDLLAGARVTDRRAAGANANREPLDDVAVAAHLDIVLPEHDALVKHEDESDLDVRLARALDLHAAVERGQKAQRRPPVHEHVNELLLGELDLIGGLPFVLAAARIKLRNHG